MENESGPCSMQLIDEDGNFNVAGIDHFTKKVKLNEHGISYVVVSIMGRQSSGKSTLLNHLFGTNFKEMHALEGRSQTTNGIWLARCVGIKPFTLVMDLEGTDGSERGQDDTTFEKQSALFALAVSDIVLINMWCTDIGCEQAANKPLLKTVIQEMMKLNKGRKTTLIFVLRDQTETPLERLEPKLLQEVQKIWDSVYKPQAHRETRLSDFFNIKVFALPSFYYQKEQFKEEVARLSRKFFESIAPGGLAEDRRDVVPACSFSSTAQKIWKDIKENKNLDLHAHNKMVAIVRCDQTAEERFSSFTESKEWCELESAAQSGTVPDFGEILGSILRTCLSGYDAEAEYFDEGVRSRKRKDLEDKLFDHVQPAFQSILGHWVSENTNKFEKAFNKALEEGQGDDAAAQKCTESFKTVIDAGYADAAILRYVLPRANWDTSKATENLCANIKHLLVEWKLRGDMEKLKKDKRRGETINCLLQVLRVVGILYGDEHVRELIKELFNEKK